MHESEQILEVEDHAAERAAEHAAEDAAERVVKEVVEQISLDGILEQKGKETQT